MTSLGTGATVTVEVSATSANLGPGFDCFGLAFDWRDTIELTVTAGEIEVEVTGEGTDSVPRDASHLILRSALTGLADLGVAVPGLRLRCHSTIPHGRGLGSSSAAIVAGLAGAGQLVTGRLDRDWLLRHANAIEGHPDNVAAAIFGGFVIAYHSPGGVSVVPGRVDPSIGAVVLVPETPVATEAARGLLPPTVPHTEAAANAGRAALLVHALAERPELLFDGTRDWLHQRQRATAMPRSYELVQSLREQGFAAVISGAGPTVAVLGTAAGLTVPANAVVPGFRTRRVGLGGAVTARTSRGNSRRGC